MNKKTERMRYVTYVNLSQNQFVYQNQHWQTNEVLTQKYKCPTRKKHPISVAKTTRLS